MGKHSPWYYQDPEQFKAAVENATRISDPIQREYQLKQLSIHNGVSLKALYVPENKTHVRRRKIIRQFGDWYVVSSGVFHGPMNYLVDKERLTDMSWEEHIQKKTWSNHADFVNAYRFALTYWKK